MPSTDPLADLLVAVANASRASLDKAYVSNSKYKQTVLKKLQAEGFIRSFRVPDEKARKLEITLQYGPKREKVLNGVKRMSRPGRRLYVGLKGLKAYARRLEIPLLSTSQGILTGAQAVSRKTGGELLCLIW